MSILEAAKTTVSVTVLLSVDDQDLLDDVTHDLLEECDTAAGKIEASYPGTQVVSVQATP